MRRLGLIALLAVALASLAPTVSAQQHRTTYEAITVSSTAIGLTEATYLGMAGCVIASETADVRWRTDGTPTSTVGILMRAESVLTLERVEDARTILFIRTASTDASLKVTCWSKE